MGIFFTVLGVMAAASEYSLRDDPADAHGDAPARSRAGRRRPPSCSVIVLVAGLVATVGLFLLSQAIYGSYGLETASILGSDAFRSVAVGVLLGPVFPVLGVALAIMMRSTAGAVSSVFALIFAPIIFGGLLPVWVQDHVLRYFPGSATDSLTISHLPDGAENIGTGVAILVTAAWLAVFIGGAYVALTRRDA